MFPQNEVSHLVCECGKIMKLPFHTEAEEGIFCGVFRVDVDAAGAGLAGRAEGRYVSVTFGDTAVLEREAVAEITETVARELDALIKRVMSGRRYRKALVVGLGNGEVTHDSLGARVCGKLEASESLAVFSVGVSGKSGIDTRAVVRALAESSQAELVIAVDSLAARSEERVGRVIQLSDGGIAPGSGMGKSVGAVDRETIGLPVISIGVPTALSAPEGKRGYLLVGEDVLNICEITSSVIADSIMQKRPK